MGNHVTSDGGNSEIAVLPNRRDEIHSTVDKVVAGGQLLSSGRKCRIWHESWLQNGLTTQQLATRSGIPQSTAYDLTKVMLEEGSLYASGSTEYNAKLLKPAPMQFFVSSHPEGIGPQFNVHSTLIGVIGRGVDSQDVVTFLERHNYTLLSEAITGVLAMLSGQTPEPTLEELFDWMDPVDARLIEGHIAGVLERESKKSTIEWTFPADPAITPISADPEGESNHD